MKTQVSVKFSFNEKKYNLKAMFKVMPNNEVLYYKSDLHGVAGVWFDEESENIDVFSITWFDLEDDNLMFEAFFSGSPVGEDAKISHIIVAEVESGSTIEEINPNYGDIIKASIKLK